MAKTFVRAGLIGAGYIAQLHADAIRATKGVELTAVCDISPDAAAQAGLAFNAQPFTSLKALIEANVCDAVHILTPPNTHRELAVAALEAGLHTLVEKPFATSRADCLTMTEAAAASGRIVAVSHNFLGLPSYQRLKQAHKSGALGRVASADIKWHYPLEPLRSGPFGLWMLRKPENLLLELGPHLFAFAVDLFGPMDDFQMSVGKPIDIPGSGTNYQSWRIMARAGHVDLTISLSLVETTEDRSVTLHGSSALARLDYANDTLIVGRKNASEIVISPLLYEANHSMQHLREGLVNGFRQVVSLNQKSPYALGFRGVVEQFYGAVRGERALDDRFTGAAAVTVIGAIEQALANQTGLPSVTAPQKPALQNKPTPTVLVIGGTGFIGSHLTLALAASGRHVRVVSRGRTTLFDAVSDKVEVASVSLKDPDGLKAAMAGIQTVFHLARSLEKTWDACLENDVGPTVMIANAALAAGVQRFIYTGTIASYDMSRADMEITEATGFGDDLTSRNLYARSKAECEERLKAMQRDAGLPLVIARPGIVVGQGGPLQHWGIGR